MGWPKRKKREPPKPLGLVSVEGKGTQSFLIASTEETSLASQTRIRGRLENAHLIEANVNPTTAAKVSVGSISGVKYPDDFNDFQDYLDSYNYIPYVARAVDIKQFMIWQMGYDLESTDEGSKKSVDDFLTKIEADTVIRDGSLYALLFGNMYWQTKNDEPFRPLNPMRMGKKPDSSGQIAEYVYVPEFGKTERFKPKEIVDLKFNNEPWALFGVGCLRRVLPTIKSLLFMEEKLPLIARRRADPLLLINIGSAGNVVDKPTYDRIKNSVVNRKPGEDIFNDGTITGVQEIYQSASVGGRQTVEPILAHFMRNLVAGLGVPEPALGFGGTTTMATADYQERILEAEIRDYQRKLKRMHEADIFSLMSPHSPVKLVWRPLKNEDKEALSKMLQGEIEHAIVSPGWARQRLGYPEDAGKNTVIDARFVPAGIAAEMQSERKKRMELYDRLSKDLEKSRGPGSSG
jgi:hypothetical protein